MSTKKSKVYDEDTEIVDLSWDTYFKFFDYCRTPMLIVFASFLLLIAVRMLWIKCEYILIIWVKDYSHENGANTDSLHTVLEIICAAVALEIVQSFGEVLIGFLIDKKMFNQMLNKVMHAPINLFFDVTPSGVILNRFGRDIDVVGRSLPTVVKWLLRDIS